MKKNSGRNKEEDALRFDPAEIIVKICRKAQRNALAQVKREVVAGRMSEEEGRMAPEMLRLIADAEIESRTGRKTRRGHQPKSATP